MTINQYRRNLRTAVRGLWSGSLTLPQSRNSFESTIERRLTDAWIQGAAECDISADELTQAELIARDDFIEQQTENLGPFLQSIRDKNQANGAPLAPHFTRLGMWVNQWSSAFQKGEAMACADGKRRWQVGRTEHCITCLRLNGKVKRLSFWLENVLPRNAPNMCLACRGFRCACTLLRTTAPISRGPLPRLAC